MRIDLSKRWLLLGIVVATGWALGGCGSDKPIVPKSVERDPTIVRLGALGSAYFTALQETGRPPANAKDIAPFLPKGIDVDALKSLRDNLPFVVCWGADIQNPTWAKELGIYAYEQKGDGDKRFVLTETGEVKLISAEQFRKASFPPGHTPAK